MARIPLLECLTRQSYRESVERSGSTPEKESDETEEGEKSTDSVLRAGPGSSESPGGGQGTSEMSDSGGLRAILDEAANPTCFNVTLLDWINVQDRPNDVESVVRKCFESINRVSQRGTRGPALRRLQALTGASSLQLDPRIIQPFLGDCRDTIAKLDNHNMKSIKGLEDRLYALDQMIASCKKLVNEQKELAQVVGRNSPPQNSRGSE